MTTSSARIRLYPLDEGCEVDGPPITRSITDGVEINVHEAHRLYFTQKIREHSACVDMYRNMFDERTLDYCFACKTTPKRMAQFWDYARKPETVRAITRRWPNVKVVWGGGPDGVFTRLQNELLMIWYDQDGGYADLLLTCPESKTYADVIDDYHFLHQLFAQSSPSRARRR